jgi:predicted amidohydrolase YtcJ
MQVVFTNGTVWTGVRTPGGIYTTHAVAVNDGRIAGMGDYARSLAPYADEVVDLKGSFLMSAFGDGHAHPLQGGSVHLYAPVGEANDVAGVVEAVRSWAAAHPDAEWIRGEGYDPTLAPGGLFDACWLDEAVSDRPVMLRASDYHTAWVNTKALELCGITADTPQPSDGDIVRRPDGSVMGTLREWGAWRIVFDHLPAPSKEDRLAMVRAASRELNKNGIAWVQDAWVEPDHIETYIAGVEADALTYRANLAMLAEPHKWDGFMDYLRTACAEIADLGDPRLRATSVKFFADGVIEQGTAAMIEEYCDCPGSRGIHNWRPDLLAEAVCEVEAAGFQAHIHAIGDAGVRSALNAFERSLKRNGWRSFPPTIAHAQVINPKDLARFSELGVVANFQPLWACNDDAMLELTAPRLGPDRTEQQYPIGTLARSGASIAFGSDWPVSSPNPLLGISVAVTREDPFSQGRDAFVPSEAIDVETALLAYTNGVAYQGGQVLDWGLVRINGRADLTQLADDPRKVDPSDLGKIAIEGTWLAGERVWG